MEIMKTVRFIGDVHGDMDAYRRCIDGAENTIQVGDFGVGFGAIEFDKNHRFIRGNHDNPGACKLMRNYIPDGTVEGKIMYVGGALSIDRRNRIEGYDWWRDEELSIVELEKMIDLFEVNKPHLMITHECPLSIVPHIFGHNKQEATRTRQAFEQMFYIHKPSHWIFGHYHRSFRKVIDGTTFICLGINETLDAEINF